MLVFLLVGCSSEETKQPTKSSNPVINFEDQEFEKIIRAAVRKNTEQITQRDMEGIDSLDINGNKVTSISEIKYCKNIIQLFITSPHVAESQDFKEFKKLKKILLRYQIIDNLSMLNCCNDLSEISIENCTINGVDGIGDKDKLKKITIKNSKIKQLFTQPVNMKKLTSFTVMHSQFNAGLDQCKTLPKTEKRININLSYNNIVDYDWLETFIGDNKVRWLNLSHNEIKSLDAMINQNQPYSSDDDRIFLNIKHNKIVDLSPLCTVNIAWLLLRGNKNILSYSPVSSFTSDSIGPEPACDFDVPTNCLVLDYKYKGFYSTCNMDRTPINKKGQDIFISPKYFLYVCGYNYEEKGDKFTLSNKKNKIVFSNQGRTMSYHGKTYTSPYPACIKDGVTYIPFKFVVKKLGGSVNKTKNTYLRLSDYEFTLPEKDFMVEGR